MAWNNQGGSGGPWGGGGNSPWNRGSGGGGNRPPDFEEMLKRGQDRMKSILPGGFGSGRAITFISVAALALWLASGFYIVDPSQVGVNLVFGAYRSQTVPGLQWNWPYPVGEVETPDVSTRYRTEVGFRSSGGAEVTEESLMLTKDENIIDIKATVLWRVRPEQVQQYLFEIKDPEDSVKNAVEAAIREIIGQSEFQPLTTTLRGEVATKATQLAQNMLDTYHAGIAVEQIAMQEAGPPTEVKEAFIDVQRASNDATSAINEAQAYKNKVVQSAQGQAVQMVREAEAYKAQKVAIAQGDAQRFLSVYEQYKLNPELTERRLYLESMGGIFGNMNKIILDPSASGAGAVPYLPLDQLLKKTQPPAPPALNDDGQTAAPSGASQ
jgi:membrane protease subunit HflK